MYEVKLFKYNRESDDHTTELFIYNNVIWSRILRLPKVDFKPKYKYVCYKDNKPCGIHYSDTKL